MRILWDEPKRLSNLDKHGLDFAALGENFFAEALVVSARGGRFQAIGSLSDRLVVVVFAPLGSEAPVHNLDAAGEQERQEVCTMTGKFRPGRGYTREDWDEVSDNPPITAEALAEAKPFAEVFPDLAESIRRGRGRPSKADAKLAVTLRLDPETVDRFKREGPDWRARMSAALKRAANG